MHACDDTGNKPDHTDVTYLTVFYTHLILHLTTVPDNSATK